MISCPCLVIIHGILTVNYKPGKESSQWHNLFLDTVSHRSAMVTSDRDSSLDISLMQAALAEAELALSVGEIPVGCVIVDGQKKIIARGHNKTNESRNGTRHAEFVAIDSLMYSGVDVSVLRECELYVTCEPCIMCASAIATLGMKKVYFGCLNERFGGNGSILSVHTDAPQYGQHSYPIDKGILETETIQIFQHFYESENRRAPESKRKRKHGDIQDRCTLTEAAVI